MSNLIHFPDEVVNLFFLQKGEFRKKIVKRINNKDENYFKNELS